MVNAKYIHIYNVVLNNTVTQTCHYFYKMLFFHIWTLQVTLNKFAKCKSREAEHNLLKMEKDTCKNVQWNLKLAMEKVGYHCTKDEVFHWGFLHFLCSVCFISFTIFVLKTTSMHFDLTYYYYTNLYVFLVRLNFQRNNKNKALVQFITNTIITELVSADLQWDYFQR